MRRPCRGCRRYLPVEDYPLAKPRADGSRHPMRFCTDCLAVRATCSVSADEQRQIREETRRQSRFRRRLQRGHW